MTPQEQQKLEHLVGRVLRDLPPRPAPPSLEARVQAELARRVALPWWRKSFRHWPMFARMGFVVVSALVVAGTAWISSGLGWAHLKTAFAAEIGWFEAAGRLFATTSDVAHTLVGSIPPLWLYGGLAIIAALYLALFGLGAAAYRALYTSAS